MFWNNVYNARVTLRGRYLNRTVGLCGTFNGRKDDDFWTSYGTYVSNVEEFGNSWKMNPACENATNVTHACEKYPQRKSIAEANCSALFYPPFNVCASHINATEKGYLYDCKYDVCACKVDPVVCYCQALDAYAYACSSYVDNILHWKDYDELSFCRKYQVC